MRNSNQPLIWILRFVVSVLFIFSAYAKLHPSVYAFEHLLVVQNITNECFAPILARCIIAVEFFLGIAFLQNHYFKKFILPATALMLIAFCIHLSYQIITLGNAGNCGCMGDTIPMTPLQALIKNGVTLIILGYIFGNIDPKKTNKHRYPLAILLICFAAVFWFYKPECGCDTSAATTVIPATTVISPIIPIDTNTHVKQTATEIKAASKTKKNDPKTPETKVSVPIVEQIAVPAIQRKTSVFAPYTTFNDGITANLDAGKNIVCLFNVDCDHCMNTAKELCEMNKQSHLPPVYILFWGDEAQGPAFFRYAGCAFPHAFIDAGKFFRLLDKAPSPPRVVVLNEGNIMGDFTSDTFTKAALLEATKK